MKQLIIAVCLLLSTASIAQPPHCKGITKAGNPCKSTIVKKSTGYCNAHDPSRAKCGGTTKAGKPCGQMPMKGQSYCRFHIN